jgi:hypothetical protein
MSRDGASINVKLLDGTTLPYEDLGDGQDYCIAVGGDEFEVDVTLTGAFLSKHEMANKRLYATCFIDGVSLRTNYKSVITVTSYTKGCNYSFKEIRNDDESRSALMFMKLELEEWNDYEDSKANALKFQASKLGMIEVFIESQISMEDTFSNRLRNKQRNRHRKNLVHVPVVKAASTSAAPAVSSSLALATELAAIPVEELRNKQRNHHRKNLVHVPVVKAASASAAPAVSSSSALATELAAIPVEEVPKAGDTVVKDTKDVLHRRTLTFTEGRQTRPPPPPATPQPAKSLVSASTTSRSPTKPKPKIWVFDKELTVLRISYQTREWFDQAKEKLRKEAKAKHNIAAGTALLDGEVEFVHQPQPKRQRGEPVVIDLTREDATDEVTSQDISSTLRGSSDRKQRCFAKADWLDVWELIINTGNAKNPQAHTKIIQDLGLTVAEDLEFVDDEIFDALFDALKPIMARKLNAKFR